MGARCAIWFFAVEQPTLRHGMPQSSAAFNIANSRRQKITVPLWRVGVLQVMLRIQFALIEKARALGNFTPVLMRAIHELTSRYVSRGMPVRYATSTSVRFGANAPDGSAPPVRRKTLSEALVSSFGHSSYNNRVICLNEDTNKGKFVILPAREALARDTN